MDSHPSLADPGLGDDDGSLTVSELAGMIRETVDEAFASAVWVRGEVADLSRSKAGHVYLDLVEPAGDGAGSPAAVLHSVIWDSRKDAINHALQKAGWGRVSDGTGSRSGRGSASTRGWAGSPWGSTRSIRATPWAGGRPNASGLWRSSRPTGCSTTTAGLEMPVAPYRIGLITSAETNAYADFTSTLAESGLGWEVLFHHSGVQGDAARRTLVAALGRMAGLAPDVICVVRGEDPPPTWRCSTMSRCPGGGRAPAPVITGIGHELDRTVSRPGRPPVRAHPDGLRLLAGGAGEDLRGAGRPGGSGDRRGGRRAGAGSTESPGRIAPRGVRRGGRGAGPLPAAAGRSGGDAPGGGAALPGDRRGGHGRPPGRPSTGMPAGRSGGSGPVWTRRSGRPTPMIRSAISPGAGRSPGARAGE